MLNRFYFLVAALVFAGGPLPAVAQVVNGSFEPAAPLSGGYLAVGGESTLVPGWTTTHSGVEWFHPSINSTPWGHYADSPDGGYAVDLAYLLSSYGGIAQAVPTVPGASYQVSFLVGTHTPFGRDGTCEIIVSADGQSQVFSHTSVTEDIGWSLKSFAFVADDEAAMLQFECAQDASSHYAYLYGVELTTTVDVAPPTFLSEVPRLEAYPNPTGGAVQLTFTMLHGRSLRIEVYELRGRRVWRAQPAASAKSVTWDCRDANGVQLPAGVYLGQVTDGTHSATRRFTILR